MKTIIRSLLVCLISLSSFSYYAQVSTTPVSSPAACDASATFDWAFFSSPYEWFDGNGTSLGANVPTITNLCPGVYSINCLDSLGAPITYTFNIGTYDPCAGFNATVNVTQNTAVGGACTGEAYVYVSGGTSPYSYNFSGLTTANPSLIDLCVGTYTLVATDANGCTSNATFNVFEDSVFVPGALNGYSYTIDESTPGSCDGETYVYAYGGTAPYTYLFSNGSTANPATGLCSGIYNVTITDDAGATVNVPFLVASTVYSPVYIDSTVLDTLSGGIYEDCTITYTTIDSSGVIGWSPVGSDSVLVTWFITSPSGTTTFTSTIYYPGAGSYAIEVGVYCPVKSVGSFIRIYGVINANNQLNVNELTELSSSVYPNPFKDNLTIQMEEMNDYTVSIIDMTGRQVLTQDFVSTTSLSISNVNTLNAGEYLLQVSSDKGIARAKIVK
ncbi:MAG: T9SS type A sorting domain-containing protein [Fluviicola sp.]